MKEKKYTCDFPTLKRIVFGHNIPTQNAESNEGMITGGLASVNSTGNNQTNYNEF